MPRLLALDNRDSFTFTLVDYLRQAGAEVVVTRSDAMSVEKALAEGRDGIMVSPGPGTPEDAGISVALAAACIEARRPYLGVCLGHQALALACGSTVGRVPPVHGKVAHVRHDGSGLFAGLPSPLDMTRYHSLAVPDPRPPLLANAWNEEGLCMGLRHEAAPAHGVQFHPESIASSHGRALVAAFVALCGRETA
ncbi:anthranilate synthase component II [Sphingomicrobium aestuariivivum]|uniref:anthranilate synthase component II n=1 Tax=Sphingomicrobium aestuariivivum TaxID=1582356 RepID=UPI001FD6DE1F|nr:aminodeoxychorismate/anthranilate synthase component II [Sphingomicrobium aestuariivivum]MCJ8190075.1 aminodeoxychorismate/anthranilate synthase component II [Sphingomicrobium aestuariivivum]